MLLFIQIVFTIAVSAFALECPPKDKVRPCTCEAEENVLIVNCEGFNSLEELEPAVKNTVGYDVSFLFLRSNLGDIPSDFFKGHTSTSIRFEQCAISSFGETPFSGLENTLKKLYIYSSIRSATNTDSFNLSHLKKLEYLALAHNDITELGNHWFEGGPVSLLQVGLDQNKIEKVGDRALASLVNLQQLYVGLNQIKAVSRSILPNPSKNLWVLELNSNEIEELPEDAFEGYPALIIIDFSKNKLKSIQENVWGKVWSQLKVVYFDGNDIVCDENLKWIYEQELPETFGGKCGPGNDLHNRDLSSLKLEDFQ